MTSQSTTPGNTVIVNELPQNAVTVNETAIRVVALDKTAIQVVAVGTPGAPGVDAELGNVVVGVGLAGTDISVAPGYGDLNIYAGANSNIVVSSDIVPSEDEQHSLGSPDRKWKEIHVSDGTIFIGDSSSISANSVSLGNFSVSDEGSLSIPGVSLVADANAASEPVSIVASDIASRSLLEAEILEVAGNTATLLTSANANLVVSVNETYTYVDGLNSNIGSILDLVTTNSNVVAAINSAIIDVGDVTNLQTSARSNIVVAVNEAYALAVAGNNDVITSQLADIGYIRITENSISSANTVVLDGDFYVKGSLYVEGEDEAPQTSVSLFDNTVHSTSGNLTLSSASGDVRVLGNLHIEGHSAYSSVIIDSVVTSNVSVGEQVVCSFNANTHNFAKLIVNTEDLTYGQYQTSEVLLTHDGTSVRLTEYAIIHTSTHPFVTYNARIQGSSVQLLASTQSSDNIISVIRFLS